jgi:hypothetical protein
MPTTYVHQNIEYFRPGHCSTCGAPTYHKPVTARRPSGREETLWVCEGCGAESHILERVENEFELLAEYIRRTYFGES